MKRLKVVGVMGVVLAPLVVLIVKDHLLAGEYTDMTLVRYLGTLASLQKTVKMVIGYGPLSLP